MEQSPLYNAANLNLPIEDPTNLTVRTTALSVYTCPSDRFTGLITRDRRQSTPDRHRLVEELCGQLRPRREHRQESRPGATAFSCATWRSASRTSPTGPARRSWSASAGLPPTQTPWAGAINGVVMRITPGSPSKSTATKTAPVELLARADTNGGTSDNLFYDPDDFYSPHPAGIYFLMADGSGKFIKAGIGPNTYGDCSL